ncbi:MAG TPA: fibronectin-binding domain-containing protein, partial [Candidatus Altiarchaeales archaeon]|nr:fibronectin-binding domain-containing protein [Candidatus Altiarchaeales archaeon]HEX55027.1 fibronectin-binding domain-containing protein [Candidatus Altiarchaeales archaeon]
MKEGLSSIDIGILAREFDQELKSGRIERIYQISERELKIRVYVRNKGSLDLIITPRYVCITKYERKAPRVASSFAMQLRKYLNGAFIKSVSQHKFDRIIEFELEKKDTRFFLVAELFSRGNVILCDSNRRIIGLLEWQKWSDRKLGVSNEYKYPPEVLNPLEIEFDKFKRILKNSERSIVATLARDLGLGGIFAEEICINSG